jgi:hypothetical protein
LALSALLVLHCGNTDGGDGGGDGDGDGDDGVQVGDEVDVDGDGVTDGKAIDTDGDGRADSYDSNGDGVADGSLTSSGSGGSGSGGSPPASGGAGVATGGADVSTGGADAGTGGAEGCVVDLECDPPVLPSTGDFAQDCVDRINQFRVGCHCLPALTRWTEAEACADANAEYDAGTGQAHSGWPSTACPDESGPLSRDMAGWATNECPGWGSPGEIVSGCMKSMYGEGAEWAADLARTPTQDDYSSCNNSCYSQNGHFIAMTKATHTHVACGIFDDDGEIWSVQNYK